ncbi:hypothetical protein FRB94_002922 [Tulasnella sp. JGI-2019a]|nr:hypothetical protein FRB93_013941 [Tulasnella sp. JGI-2019a]KAG9013394.1 hypothetical protein FRB94_002922 [Tulasnella sp. JGI-2019a]KAG9033743.1 hypothetical protein FRB95_014430 [Tulasnella sp. JGI-2019a]
MAPKRDRRRQAPPTTPSPVPMATAPDQPSTGPESPEVAYKPSDLLIKETLDKGKGVFTTTHIAPGTCIIAEQPIVAFPANNEDQIAPILQRCSEEDKRKFLSFGYVKVNASLDPFRRIVKTNCLPMASRGQVGLFETICRVNHDCRPNALYCWDEALGKEVLHALVDIPAGEEISVNYYSILDGPARRAVLQSKFGFTCKCSCCSLPPSELGKSDKREAQLSRIIDTVAILIRTNPVSAIAQIRQAIVIIEREKDYGRLTAQFADAFQICAAWRDLPNAKVWATRAAEASRRCYGDGEDAASLRAFAEDPTTHRLWGALGTRKLSS